MPQHDPFSASEVESRRRTAKPLLSRDAIVEEALRQITSDARVMSLRKIAKALDTGPASLYAYVNDVSELQALVLDRVLEAVEVGQAEGSWRDRLEGLLRSYTEVLMSSPAVALMAVRTTAVGPNALRIAETLLGLLAEAGADRANAAWAIDMLTMFVTAVAAEHAHGTDPAAPDGPIAQAINRAPADEYPRVHAARDEIMSGTGEERFTWSIDILIRGILSRAAGSTSHPSGVPPCGRGAASRRADRRSTAEASIEAPTDKSVGAGSALPAAGSARCRPSPGL